MKIASVICANILSASFFACVSAFSLAEIRAKEGNAGKEPDYLLILGCRVKGEKAQETLRMRIDAAAKYLSEHKNVIAICCGGIVHADQLISEAQVICDGLVKAGIEKERIILEDKSTTTEENFINARKIIDSFESERIPEIAFLSSEFHLLRAGVIAKKAGVDASCVAAPSPKNKRIQNYAREFLVFPAVYIKKRR